MRKNIKDLINKRAPMNLDQDCWRGLECFETSSRDRRFRRSILPVLRMQSENEESGVCDPRGIRSFAISLNRKATEEGIRRASQDFMDAYEIYREGLCTSAPVKTTKQVDSSCAVHLHTAARPVPAYSRNTTARTA